VRHGRHRVELRLAGFEPYRTTFDAAGRELALRYELRRAPTPDAAPAPPPPAPGDAGPAPPGPDATAGPPAKTSTERPRSQETAYLNLLARPWAKVWINGRPAGQTPLIRFRIPAGPVVVRLQVEGRGETRTIRFRARPGETISRQVVLAE